jgi:hypothetical protein
MRYTAPDNIHRLARLLSGARPSHCEIAGEAVISDHAKLPCYMSGYPRPKDPRQFDTGRINRNRRPARALSRRRVRRSDADFLADEPQHELRGLHFFVVDNLLCGSSACPTSPAFARGAPLISPSDVCPGVPGL